MLNVNAVSSNYYVLVWSFKMALSFLFYELYICVDVLFIIQKINNVMSCVHLFWKINIQVVNILNLTADVIHAIIIIILPLIYTVDFLVQRTCN